MNGPSDPMFTIVPIIVTVGFILVFGLIIFAIVKGIVQWSSNNKKPVLTVDARIVAKRTDVGSSMTNGDQLSSRSRTDYFVTFEVESGDRMEFEVSGQAYGMLVEGDDGRLTFQGTRYQGFQRSGASRIVKERTAR
ncbi:DUF2500 family protein [Paenibacillus sp. T1]|uniref:DUF2500 family protein n=2 Tax=Paenibacillus glycinis TaxID=2697035 RepID=A0ABW9XTK5_9BACL|nr:DUF2500 family protein [Paenibacillus glycinis]